MEGIERPVGGIERPVEGIEGPVGGIERPVGGIERPGGGIERTWGWVVHKHSACAGDAGTRHRLCDISPPCPIAQLLRPGEHARLTLEVGGTVKVRVTHCIELEQLACSSVGFAVWGSSNRGTGVRVGVAPPGHMPPIPCRSGTCAART